MTKMTKREKFALLAEIPAVKDNAMLSEFIVHEVEMLDRKNSTPKKPTSAQIANEAIKDAIYDGMTEGRCYTITELVKEIAECADLTNQRVSALVRQMKEEGRVERLEEKRKAYFRKVA